MRCFNEQSSTCFTPLHTGQPSLLACQLNSYLNIFLNILYCAQPNMYGLKLILGSKYQAPGQFRAHYEHYLHYEHTHEYSEQTQEMNQRSPRAHPESLGEHTHVPRRAITRVT